MRVLQEALSIRRGQPQPDVAEADGEFGHGAGLLVPVANAKKEGRRRVRAPALICRSFNSEGELEPELNQALVVDGVPNDAEGRAPKRSIWRPELRTIKDIKELGTELDS